MNLGEIRSQFAELSGRYDLITSDGSDNGADFFLQRGQDHLDRQLISGAATQIKDYDLSAGSWTKLRTELRIVENIWLKVTDSWTKLRRVDYQDLVDLFPKLGNTSQGNPSHYSIVSTYSANRIKIYILPPPETSVSLKIQGIYKAAPVSADSDTNFWTDLYPDILIMAAQREIETFYRNSQGVEDWDRSIQAELTSIDMDYVNSQTSHINQMEG